MAQIESARMAEMPTHLEDLYPDSECVPIFRTCNFLLWINIEQDLERFKPFRKDRSGGLLDGLRMLILHHVQSSYTLPEHRYSTCSRQSSMLL